MPARTLLAVLAAASLSGCATPQSGPLPLFELPPSTLGSRVSVAQHLQVTLNGAAAAAGQPPALDTLLEVDPERLRLVALAWGTRVLTLDWDGRELQTQRHVPLPAQFDERRILRDIQLAYWPRQALEAALPAGWSLWEDATERQLRWHDAPMVSIRVQASPPWLGSTELNNHKEGYRLTLDNLAQARPTP